MGPIYDRVKQLVSEEFGVPTREIYWETTRASLNADSLDLVSLVMAVCNEFGITIPDEDLAGLDSVGDLVRYLERRIAE